MTQRDVGVHNEAGLFPDQERSIRRVLHREIETKIIDGIDIDQIKKKLSEMGGMLVREHVTIRDRNFALAKQRKERASVQYDVRLPSIQAHESEHLRDALRYLGLPILAYEHDQDGGYYRVARPSSIPRRSVRLREINKGEELIFGVKEARKKNKQSTIDSRVEIEVPLVNTENILDLLRQIGYEEQTDIHNQKDRTSYALADCSVEINSAPHLEIPDWIEIEGPSPEGIKRVASQLGIPEALFRSMSLGDQIEYFKAKKESGA